MFLLISLGGILIEFLITGVPTCIRESGFLCELRLLIPDCAAADHVGGSSHRRPLTPQEMVLPFVYGEQAGHSSSLPTQHTGSSPCSVPFVLLSFLPSCLPTFLLSLLQFFPPSLSSSLTFLLFLPPLFPILFFPIETLPWHLVLLCSLNTRAEGSALPKKLLSDINTLIFLSWLIFSRKKMQLLSSWYSVWYQKHLIATYWARPEATVGDLYTL